VLPPEGKVDNELKVTEPLQVSLHVRIAEMNRTLTRDLGVNWAATSNLGKLGNGNVIRSGVSTNTNIVNNSSATTPTEGALQLINGGMVSLETAIDALSEDQLIHILAEPNLTTMSGEPASFLAGGEFPIPVSTSSNTVSLEFKQYGISLAFVPTVIAHDQIILHVRPEVSQLDKADGVTFLLGSNGGNTTGVSIPALTVRRADTTVQLGSGQSFVIAGLLQDQTTMTGNAVPGLGDVPILGALFRSDSFQRNESELVIVVTPYIVKPVSDPNALHLPTDGWRVPNDIERILYLRQSGGPLPAVRHMPADAGFMTE
jgi:pilus assembly protein CpaC